MGPLKKKYTPLAVCGTVVATYSDDNGEVPVERPRHEGLGEPADVSLRLKVKGS